MECKDLGEVQYWDLTMRLHPAEQKTQMPIRDEASSQLSNSWKETKIKRKIFNLISPSRERFLPKSVSKYLWADLLHEDHLQNGFLQEAMIGLRKYTKTLHSITLLPKRFLHINSMCFYKENLLDKKSLMLSVKKLKPTLLLCKFKSHLSELIQQTLHLWGNHSLVIHLS
jgi:hypothetical protein